MGIKQILFGKNDYGFTNQMPNKCILEQVFLDTNNIHWAITSDYDAKNHCGATASTNIERYINDKKSIKLIEENNFPIHYKKIGNGPVISFKRKTKKILKQNKININTKTKFFNKINFIKEELNHKNILSLLLVNAPFNWHWILCTGITIFEDGDVILQIVDNWNNSKRYYKPNQKSLFLLSTSFRTK